MNLEFEFITLQFVQWVAFNAVTVNTPLVRRAVATTPWTWEVGSRTITKKADFGHGHCSGIHRLLLRCG